MKLLTLDFETYYAKDYTLKKQSPVEYILDPRFECTGLAVKRGQDPAFWVHGDEVQQFFDSEPEDVAAISHNALFDMCICYWRYGWLPKLMIDTLGVSRSLLRRYLKSMSLKSVADHLQLGQKGGALANVINMRLADIRSHPQLYINHIEYGINDAELCYGIFEKLVMSGQYPKSEIAIMDSVLRCAVVPKFIADTNVLHDSLAKIKAEKENTLTEAMLLGADGKSSLMSNEQFAQLLRKYNVDPPTKISPLTGKEGYAFAKSDVEFLDLLEHPSVAVQALVAARLGHKSTIEETRTERFINIANLQWPATKYTSGGNLQLVPMPLRVGGAHTHRLSGDWSMNVQNMGRGSALRQSLTAPEGWKVVAGDESQVEARFVATLCGQEDLRLAFERGEDVYSIFAAILFGRLIDKSVDKKERFIGKQSILGLGFGLGWEKFGRSIPILSQNQMGVRIEMPEDMAKRTVTTYRTKYDAIEKAWKFLNTAGINALMGGGDIKWGPVLIKKEEIVLPNGLSLYYHNIKRVPGGNFGTEVIFEYDGRVKRIYGGKLLENIVQALARIITMEAAVRIEAHLKRIGVRLALQVHDELVFVVEDRFVEVTRKVLEHELRQRPWWLPNIPLDCETGVGQSYGNAK